MWFTNHRNWSIGRITTAGVVSNYTADTIAGPQAIASGPDGALWFIDTGGGFYSPSIGRITTAGMVKAFSLPSGDHPYDIVAGPDNALWFTQTYEGNGIGRISTGGTVTHYADTGSPVSAVEMALGSDGALWFTTFDNDIGRITTKVTP